MTKVNNAKEATEEKGKKVAINEAAQKQIEEQKAIEEAKRVLNEQIEKFNRKNQLIADREMFIRNKSRLNEALSKIGSDSNDSLNQDVLRITLATNDYDSGKVSSISNTLIVREFVTFVSQKIDIKVAEIEKEILNG